MNNRTSTGRRRLAALVLVLGGVTPARGQAPSTSAFDELVAAERAFAAAARSGVSPAFLEVLADDGVVFSPGPVSGREVHTTRPFSPASSLVWHPRLAAVSRAGDLGYTTGPWVSAREGRPGAAGHYVSVWQKRDGRWRLLADIGTGHPPLDDHEVDRAAVPFPEIEPVPSGAGAGSAPAETSARMHAALARGDALPAGVARNDVRVYVQGTAPRHGHDALTQALTPLPARWDVERTVVAESGDLAYRHGTFVGTSAQGNFLELWTRGADGWSLALLVFQASGGGA